MANKKIEVNVEHIIKDIEAGKFTSFQSILNETGGQHIYEAVNEELRKYLKENNAVMISATQLAHLRETGYKDFESEKKALETQLRTASGDLKRQIEGKLKDLKKFQYYSERKAPIGDELHKILELTDKGLVDLNDAVKAADQIMKQMQIDPQTNEKLKGLVGRTSTDTMKNFRKVIKNAQDFQKMKISAGMVGGETETARSMAFKKDGKLYVVSGSTDWTKAKEGKIGDYKTTASFSAMHNLIQSVVNATLIRAQEGVNLPITSKVAHLPINAGRMKYANTLPGVYDIKVGSYQEGVKLISDLIDVLEGRKSFTDVKIPGSVQGVAEKGPFTYKNEVREAMYYNGKPIGQWVGQTVEEVKSLLDSLQPQQRQQFLGSLFGETDGKPWYNTENAKLLKEAFRSMYQPTQKDFKTYGGMSLSTLSGKFASGEITKDALISAIREGTKTQGDTEELASRLFFGEDKYYSKAFVDAIKEAIPEVSSKITDIFDRELDKTTAGYLSGLNEDEKPKPSKYDMYAPDVWELEEKKQQAWIESGVERMKLGYTDKPLFDDKGIKTLADRMTRLVDFYQRTTNIFSKVAEDINKDLPADTQPYTGEELARTYLARKSPEVYDRYMRSKGLYEGFTSQAQGLPLEDQVQWIRKQLDTFIAEEGNLLNTFDTFAEIADQKSKDVFSKEFARKISYVGAPGGYVAPGTLYGLLMGSTFGVAQESQMPEFDKQRNRDIYGRTLSAEAIDKLTQSQADDDISKIDFYKQKLTEMADTLGVSSEKIGIFSDYLDKVQKVADQAGIELEQVLEGVDEQGFIKEKSLLDKQLRAINEAPVESLYLPTSGKHGIGGKARKSLFGLFDDTGMESLATQYDIYLDEQDAKRKEELKKQNDIRVQKEQEFTKLVDTELENRLKFLYAETAKPEYIKAQEAAERNEDSMGLSPEMFKGITEGKQKGMSIGSTINETTQKIDELNQANEDLLKATKQETDLKQKLHTVNWQYLGAGINGNGGANYQYYYNSAGDILKVQATSSEVADLSKTKPTSITTDFEGKTIGRTYKYLNDKVFADYGPGGLQSWIEKWKNGDMQAAQAELIGILTKVPSYKKSSGGLSKAGRTAMDEILTDTFGAKYQPQQGVGAILNETKGIHQDTTDIKNLLSPVFGGGNTNNFGAAYKNLNWIAFQKWAEATNGTIDDETTRTRTGIPDGGKEQATTDKQQKQDIREYQQYVNKLISLESQVDKLQRQAALSSGKHREAIDGAIVALQNESDQLTENNSELIKRVSVEQAATKAQIDSTAALKKQSNAQKNLVSVKGATSIWDMMANDIRRATMRVADFGIAAKLLNKIPQDIQKVIQYTKELDAAMTNVRIVTGVSAEEAKTLAKQYTQLAKELGSTTTEIANSANEWARQGYEAEEANNLIIASTKLAKLGMISTTEATKDLTSAIKGFKLSTEEAMSVVDKLTKIDQVAAISAGNLAEGLARVATTAQQAGLSLDETAAMVTTITEVTQRDASTAGEALRTLISRYSNVKAGVFTSMGEEAEETSGNINDIEKVLGKLGIRIRTSGTEMRSIEDVLDELAEKWNTLDDVSRNAVASAFAGVRQRESFNILLSNWDRVKELTEESANAAGTANEKYEAYMDSMEAATKRLQNAWEGFTQKVEGSAIIKGITNVAAAFTENIGPILKILGGLTAVFSAEKIFSFLSPGESGGFKGLLSNIPFLGRGTKTNNYLESIDKNVKGIRNNQTAEKIGATKNGSFLKDFIQKGFGRGDIVDPETGESISYADLKMAEKMGIETDTLRKYQGLLVKRQLKQAAIGATSALISNLVTTKQVGGGVIGKAITGSEQTVEETTGGKALRTALATGLAAVGSIWGPIGSMVGQIAGEGIGGIISTIVHRSDIEMKQRVQIAKENVNKLDNLVSTIDSGDRLLSEEINTAEGYQDLYDYTDKLYEQLFELQYERDIDITEAFNNALANNDESVHITKISDLVDSINTGNVEQRKMIKRQLEIAESQVKIAEIRKAQEAERKKANDAIKSDEIYKETMFETASPQLKGFNFEGLEWKGWAKNKLKFSQTGLSTDTKNEILKKNIALLREAITQTSNTSKIEAYNTFIKSFEKFTNKVDSAYATIEKLNKEVFKSEVNFGFLSADIHDLSDEELQDLTMDGIMGRVVQTMEKQGYEVRDTAGYIKKDYADAIKTQITNDSELSALQNVSTKTLSELTAAQERFTDATGATIDEWNKWYDLAVKGALSEEIAKIVYAANPEKIEQFARAWNMTTEEIKGLVEEFPNLTTAIGLMNPSQVREYYGGFTGIFDDWSNDLVLSASNLEKLISDYPQLLKYYKSGTLSSELIKSMGNEQAVAYSNALFNEIISSKGVGSEFKKALKEQDETFIGIASSNEIESVYKQYLIGLKDINSMIEKSIELKQSDNEEERKAGELITSLINKYMDYEQEIEWANPFYDKAKQAEIELFERQINNLEEQKNALSDVNSEREKELELIKAKEALENAKKEKRRVYRAGIGFVMEADEDAITQAQKQISELDISKKQDDIQLQIDQYELLKNILSSQDDEKTKQNNKEALDEWLKSSGYNGVSDVVSALIEGYAKNKLVINVGSGVIKDADGNIIGKTGNIGDDESGYIGSKNENIAKSSEKLSSAIGNFVEAENKIKSMKIGQAGYAEAAQDYEHKKDALNKAVTSADTAGVKSVDMNYARKLLSGYQEPTHTDWKLIEDLSNPSTKGHAAEGTHDIMLTTDHPLTSKEKDKQFKKDKYSYIKLYDAGNKSWGSWESLTKVEGRNISNLPDYTIIMNDDYKDAYAFVKDGKLYWLSDTKGNVKKEYTWQETWASGTLSTPTDSTALINELGTEAVITPGGTLTALPSKTGIVPADITRNVWALGEVAPTLVAQLSSLNQKALTGNAGNTTYEEGQYIDNLTMNVYPTKDYDMDKLLSEARAKAKLTRHNN